MLNPLQVPRLTCYLQPDLQEEVSSCAVLVLMVFKVRMAFSTEVNPPPEQDSVVAVWLPWQRASSHRSMEPHGKMLISSVFHIHHLLCMAFRGLGSPT